jgi:hypothetical protein
LSGNISSITNRFCNKLGIVFVAPNTYAIEFLSASGKHAKVAHQASLFPKMLAKIATGAFVRQFNQDEVSRTWKDPNLARSVEFIFDPAPFLRDKSGQ